MMARIAWVLPLAATFCVACAADAVTYPAGAIVYGEVAPPPVPAARADLVPPAPSASHIWIGGQWGWSSNGYVWTPGRWVARPRADAEWESAHWDVRGRHHVWVNGYFR